MRKWFLPLTVLSIGGLGALAFSERGRQAIDWLFERIDKAPDKLAEINDSMQTELDRIQSALNDIADSLNARPIG